MKKDIDSHYQILGNIGEGTYSTVFKAVDQRTDQVVALKRVKIRKAEEGLPKEFVREIESLQRLLHENIIKVEEVFIGKTNINIVYPFCECDLDQIMSAKIVKPLTISQIRFLMKQLLTGLKQMHGIGLMHRDIKPSNLFMYLHSESESGDKMVNLKLGDFGQARLTPKDKPNP